MIKNIILVAFGGAIGSVCRYLVSKITDQSFPWMTLTTNIAGSFLIGILFGLVTKGVISNDIKMLMITGFCGGFTTFSTFANESYGMLRSDDILLSTAYIGASVTIGVLAVALGIKITEL